MRFNLLSLFVLATLIAIDSTHAGEGMWVPQQLPEIAGPLKQAGLQLSPEQLSNLTGDPMGQWSLSAIAPRVWFHQKDL